MNRSVAAGAVGLSIWALSSAAARADIQYFDNSAGQFEWTESFWVNSDFFHGASLDLQQGPAQDGAQTPMSLQAYAEVFITSGQVVNTSIVPNNPSVMSVATRPQVLIGFGPNSDFVFPAVTYPLGEPVAASITGGSWTGNADVNYRAGVINQSLIGGRAFVGVRLNLADGAHFGWIDLIDNGYNANPSFTAVGWAYETAPNTPIAAGAVPAPSAVACVLGGLVAAARRRR